MHILSLLRLYCSYHAVNLTHIMSVLLLYAPLDYLSLVDFYIILNMNDNMSARVQILKLLFYEIIIRVNAPIITTAPRFFVKWLVVGAMRFKMCWHNSTVYQL